MESREIDSDDGRTFTYNVDNAYPASGLGYSMYTCPITTSINGSLKKITNYEIDKLVITNNEKKDMVMCNLAKSSLVGKYYDGNGFVYYAIGETIYRFCLKLESLKELF